MPSPAGSIRFEVHGEDLKEINASESNLFSEKPLNNEPFEIAVIVHCNCTFMAAGGQEQRGRGVSRASCVMQRPRQALCESDQMQYYFLDGKCKRVSTTPAHFRVREQTSCTTLHKLITARQLNEKRTQTWCVPRKLRSTHGIIETNIKSALYLNTMGLKCWTLKPQFSTSSRRTLPWRLAKVR